MNNEFVRGSKQWFAQYNIWNNGQLNDLILNCMLAHKSIKNATIDLNIEAKEMFITLYLSRFSLLLYSKNRISENVKEIINSMYPNYNIDINFQIYNKKVPLDFTNSLKTKRKEYVEVLKEKLPSFYKKMQENKKF